MRNNKQNQSSRGYYIALILCAAAIGITGYVFTRSGEPALEPAAEETWQDVQVGAPEQADIPAIATGPQDVPSVSTAPTESAKKPLKPVSPVSGARITGYSMEVLSYNQTTRDWRVHNGIDLAAEEGQQVVSAADGEVVSVTQDDSLGCTVTVRHADGYTTCYASLAEDIPVKAGDTVAAGDVIGCAGESAITESTLGTHVHFCVSRYDQPMDPEEFLALGE